MTDVEYVDEPLVAVTLVVMTGDTDWTSGALLAFEIKDTDAELRLVLRILVPLDVPLPPLLNTVNVFEPSAWIEFSIDWEVPVPMARSTMTDATPMRTPSMVSNVRSQFEPMPRTAMIKL